MFERQSTTNWFDFMQWRALLQTLQGILFLNTQSEWNEGDVIAAPKQAKKERHEAAPSTVLQIKLLWTSSPFPPCYSALTSHQARRYEQR